VSVTINKRGPQRRWERAEVSLAVVCRSQDEVLDDIAKKLGAGGMFIECSRPSAVGSIVELQFNLPGLEAPIELRGRVASVQECSSNQAAGMGIEFLDVEEALRSQMDEAVQSVSAIATSPH
jgi:uncharacterized protein (TIGR02266 family)